MRISLLPGLLIKALPHLPPHWISSTQSTLSYLISLRSALHPPTYIQITHMESLPWKFPCKISYKFLIFKHFACRCPFIALQRLVKCTYYGTFHYIHFQFISIKWLNYFIHLATYMLSESFLEGAIYMHEFWHLRLLIFLHKYRLTCYW
jgi:hypothetical protein